MSGDYTRFTFDPLKRYSGVLMQQGRVQLDSDWNEEIDILRRRIRTTTLDILGPVGVPYVVSPNAFKIGWIPGPPADLSIGPGRLYVDGIQIEAFAEDGATYNHQPFFPPPLAGFPPPPLPAAGDAVVYLDVWEREVTYIEDPALLDVALGGADTTTRRQTVWQVRVDPMDNAACGVPVGEPPSAGRLTSRAIAPPAPDDPCILPPASGYRGLENRLYRVEIHSGGAARHGALQVVARQRLDRLGRARHRGQRHADDALRQPHRPRPVPALPRRRLGDGHRRSSRTHRRAGRDGAHRQHRRDQPPDRSRSRAADAGRPSVRRQRRLRSPRGTRACSGGTRPALPIRSTPTALFSPAAGPIPIEDGIEIEFSTDPAGGSFRVGDYWVFWARTATAQIEELTDAPPRGIIHHYVQLAAITGLGGAEPTITDCRPPPQQLGDCCCTIIVRPGENIQAGIDALPAQGGCVCLKTGLHVIREPLRIVRGSIVLKAESPERPCNRSAAGRSW